MLNYYYVEYHQYFIEKRVYCGFWIHESVITNSFEWNLAQLIIVFRFEYKDNFIICNYFTSKYCIDHIVKQSLELLQEHNENWKFQFRINMIFYVPLRVNDVAYHKVSKIFWLWEFDKYFKLLFINYFQLVDLL